MKMKMKVKMKSGSPHALHVCGVLHIFVLTCLTSLLIGIDATPTTMSMTK